MLPVDLSEGKIETKELTEDVAESFVAAYGLGARVLYDMMKPGVDPLSPEAGLGFVTGPLNGTGALFGGRYAVVCKSPVTGGWSDANSGGYFGPELKKADFAAPKKSVGEPPQEEGPLAGCKVDHKYLKRNFFAAMEWDEETGKPGRESLEALGGMDDVVQDLYG